jgi:hypothetical protein
MSDEKDDSGALPEDQVEDKGHAGSDSENEGIESLKAQLAERDRRIEEQQRRAEAAEAAAQRAARDIDAARQAEQAASVRQIDGTIDLAKTDIASAKAALKAAFEAGDGDKLAEAQTVLNDAVYRFNRANEYRARFGAPDDRARTQEGRVPERRQATSSDPVDEMASRLSPRSAEWVRKHPECAVDGSREQKRMLAAHYEAMAEGHVPDSDAYFEFIDGRISPPKRETRDTDDRETSSKRPSAAAPPAREAPSRSGDTRKRQVRLTQDEMSVCKTMGWDPEKYARDKAELQENA